MARVTIAEIVATLPAEKKDDTPWSKFVLRPLSFPAAWIFLALGWGPNAVTYLSAVFCVCGFGFLAAGPVWAAWMGMGFFFLFGILDCADGNVARVRRKPSPWGAWVDAFGGYVAYTTILLGAGAVAQTQSGGTLPGIGAAVLPWGGACGRSDGCRKPVHADHLPGAPRHQAGPGKGQRCGRKESEQSPGNHGHAPASPCPRACFRRPAMGPFRVCGFLLRWISFGVGESDPSGGIRDKMNDAR